MKTPSLFELTFGKPIEPIAINIDDIPQKEKLPGFFVELIKEDGTGGYADDFIWTVNPAELIPYTNRALKTGKEATPIIRTSFGDIIFFVPNKTSLTFCALNFRHREIMHLYSGTCEAFFNETLVEYGFLLHKLRINLDLYWFAYENFGSIDRTSCYGYITPPADGGVDSPENITRYDLDSFLEKECGLITSPLNEIMQYEQI
ncbi:MAG: GAD-like domain-containing protein [Spirochaetes bacterium]|jgi:hypothetical protein|nr:GAD-like domain-containing protein [Spirochaetota bacterium]